MILVHGVLPGKSIYDLLFMNKKRETLEVAGEAFVKEIDSLKEELKHVVDSIEIVFYGGAPQSSFNHFLEANQVDKIVIPTIKYNWSGKRSFNILPYLHRAKVKKQVINWENDPITNSSSSKLITSHAL